MDALSHALAGAVGGVIAMAVLYPLENVRTRLQVQIEQRKQHSTLSPPSPSSSSSSTSFPSSSTLSPAPPLPPDHYHGTLDCIVRVCRTEGWHSLYTGLSSALVGVGVSSAVYFFWYHLFRSHLLRLRQRGSLPALDNLLVASVAGALNIMCTLPIWVINTRITLASPHRSTRYSSILHTFHTILREEGVQGLYKGLLPSLILVSNPAIQFLAYEQLVRLLSAYYRSRHRPTPLTLTSVPTHTANTEVRVEVGGGVQVPVLSALDFFVLGAVSKAVATVATYPYQVVRTRMMGDAKRVEGVGKGQGGSGVGVREMRDVVMRMLVEEGVHSFFQGMSAKLTQTVLNSALMFVIYEKMAEAIRSVLSEAYTVEQKLQHKVAHT